MLLIVISNAYTCDADIVSTYFKIFCFIVELKQRYTQSNGRRPFGISCLIGGFDSGEDEKPRPRLYQTEPSGTYHEWKANATGRNAKTVSIFIYILSWVGCHLFERISCADLLVFL